MATNARQTRTRAEVNKTVTVLAYFKEQDWREMREVSAWLDGDHDYFAGEEKTTEKRYFKLGGQKDRIRDDERWEELTELDLGDGELIVEEETWFDHKWGASYGATVSFRSLMRDVSVAPTSDAKWNQYNTRLATDGFDVLAKASVYLSEERMLKHPSKLTGEEDDPYTDDETEYWCLKVRFSMNELPEATVERLTEQWVKGFIEVVKDVSWIGRVRWADCETEVTEKGVCYNI